MKRFTRTQYFSRLDAQIDRVFRGLPRKRDHRGKYPWLTGYLGNPFSGIWFVAENPSLKRMEAAASRAPSRLSPDMQWAVSPGDLLFREMLFKYGFKTGSPTSPGGWRCYITDVVKEADYVNTWHATSDEAQAKVARRWARVLLWELRNSRPRLVVVMGRRAQRLFSLLVSDAKGLPQYGVEYVTHYSYIGSRPQGHLPPLHPARRREYSLEFKKVERAFSSLPA